MGGGDRVLSNQLTGEVALAASDVVRPGDRIAVGMTSDVQADKSKLIIAADPYSLDYSLESPDFGVSAYASLTVKFEVFSDGHYTFASDPTQPISPFRSSRVALQKVNPDTSTVVVFGNSVPFGNLFGGIGSVMGTIDRGRYRFLAVVDVSRENGRIPSVMQANGTIESAFGFTVVAIPEPSTLVLLLLLGVTHPSRTPPTPISRS